LIRDDKTTKLDFEQEMSRFLPQNIRANTLNNTDFWGYVGRELMADVTQINKVLAGEKSANSPKFKM
jgi:hypothetical protein